MENALRTGGRDPDLRLIETFSADAPADRLELHLARMGRSAAALGWEFDAQAARRALSDLLGQSLRLRLTLDGAGRIGVTSAPLSPPAQNWRVSISDQVLASADPWLGLKSTRRATHDAARGALAPGIDEAILCNERGEVCEGTISTLFFDRGAGMYTPPLTSGLLPGILRQEMIADGVREGMLLVTDLPQVRLWMGNSLRGLIPAQLV